MESARILVAGAGALGSLYGAFLRRAGHRVTLLGRAAHLEAIHERGLEVDGLFGEAMVAGFELATRAADLGRPFDLIVLAVKCYAVEPTVKPWSERSPRTVACWRCKTAWATWKL